MTLDPLIGQVLLERYEVLRRIGSGGMGAVYVGRQEAVGREVALKVLRSDLIANEHVRQRFRREAEIIGRLNHPNTIQLIDYGETPGGLAVMVMELLRGKALSERLKADGPLPLIPVLELGSQIASSLAEAHLIGLVHRDLKPANIFLTEVGAQVHGKVLDFGIARLLDEEATRLTSTGQVFGTPRYMSPEQAMSTADVDARSDLYSLGLILYECLVGQPPFVAQTSIQYLSAHTTEAPPRLKDRLPEAPAALDELIDACLAKEPEDRPQTADEVNEVLQSILLALRSGSASQPIVVPRGRSAVGSSAPTQPASSEIVADTAISTRGPPTAEAEPPPGGGAKSWTPLAIGGLVALALIGAITFGVFGPWRDRDAPTARPIAEDAGAAPTTVLAQRAVDAGAPAIAIAVAADGGAAAPDAGEAAPDAEVEAPPDAGRKTPVRTKPRVRKPKRKRDAGVQSGGGNQTGQGAFTGPRGLVIDDVPDATTDPVRVAERCSKSVFRGLSKLTVTGCPKGCKVVIDAQCAGVTPAVDRAMSPGRRTVSVVCGGKLRRTATVRFRAEETTTFRCR